MISKILYQTTQVPLDRSSEFYWHQNMMEIHPDFIPDYEEYEIEQMNIRNTVIGDAIREGRIPASTKTDKAMIAISPMRNKVVVICEI